MAAAGGVETSDAEEPSTNTATPSSLSAAGTTNDAHVRRATYPLPAPLARRLKAGMLPSNVSVEAAATSVIKEDLTTALGGLVGNAIQAIDNMYFSTPASFRKDPAFGHRLCLRVTANPAQQTLSLTDLGAGMTRADLINMLGIGRAGLLGSSSGNIGKKESLSDLDDGEDDEEGETEEEEETDEDEDTDEDAPGTDQDPAREETSALESTSAGTEKPSASTAVNLEGPLSCRAKDVGGFYAALVALGTGVRLETKSKFDDYYQFQLGLFDPEAPRGVGITAEASKAFEEFCITRPYAEGTQLSVENGFGHFSQIRGESGTCVTIRLNEAAIAAGYLDETKLHEIFRKIVETTQYTVAFSTDPDAPVIVEASAKEMAALEARAQQPDELDASLEAVADMEISHKDEDGSGEKDAMGRPGMNSYGSHNTVQERSKYIPLRLSLGERKMLRLMEASMNCCDYTTEVDRPFKSVARRTHAQLKGVTAVLQGLVTACDYESGQKLARADQQDDNGDGDDEGNTLAAYETFFCQMFEIARRHKIMNPEKMRTEYGKLVYLLQDAVSPSLRPHLSCSVKGPIQSVYKFLQDRGGVEMLSDKVIETATEEILAERKSRAKIDQEIRRKERAVSILKKRYRSNELSEEDIHLCLYSICDNNSFLNSNRVPIDKIIDYLTTHFSPTKMEKGYSLSIISGSDGARLSHSHERQYYYALQSLSLWRDIIDDMFRLWAMAEEDLLSETVTYALQDTGQGMQRVQQSPRVYKAMQDILHRVQDKVQRWVGSSVIHLGDHNVNNALSFIDKYTQVPRILAPIVSCLENLERICEKNEGIQKMVDRSYGGLEKLRKDILYDFFRSAFDGSGGETYYDAGSCIDGRLTSAWNWCSQLPSKPFYPIFKLTGFIGFDGAFK